MRISIEVPVFKGRFLRSCIDSVFAQTSDAWTLSLVWDGGDAASREILEQIQRESHPRVQVWFTENQGIAAARKFLTDHTRGEYILPLDDDDVLRPEAVHRFVDVATERPWASLIRARRVFIDEEGAVVGPDSWFPFGPRHYDRGMVTDVFNQAQPYLIRRSAYDRTRGWTGFPDFHGAGEDCDMFLQLEEVASFELVDEVLYHYRLHGDRASHGLTSAAAFEMWRRLCDAAIARMGLPLRRTSAAPPFAYESLPRPASTLDDVDFVLHERLSAASLLDCGVNEDAVHTTANVADSWRMAGFRSTRRRLICFLDEHAAIDRRSALETLVRSLNDAQADLLATDGPGNILLVRREVLAATGGFDERYIPASLQTADLCMQARRRGFRCVEIETDWTSLDVSALKSRWGGAAAVACSTDSRGCG
jgi:GT2 family glycosyltransferase